MLLILWGMLLILSANASEHPPGSAPGAPIARSRDMNSDTTIFATERHLQVQGVIPRTNEVMPIRHPDGFHLRAHSRITVWRNRSALPLVRGV